MAVLATRVATKFSTTAWQAAKAESLAVAQTGFEQALTEILVGAFLG